MTPEERFTRIENSLNTVAEHQAQMAEQQYQMLGHQSRHDQEMTELRKLQKSMSVAIMKVAEAHRKTEKNLNALINTVDRITGKQGGLLILGHRRQKVREWCLFKNREYSPSGGAATDFT